MYQDNIVCKKREFKAIEEMSILAHYQAYVKASMEEMSNESLGKTNWMITSKEMVKMLTIFVEDGLLILSIDSEGEHDQIIKKIQNRGEDLLFAIHYSLN